MTTRPTALIADDEPLLRDALQRLLTITWPDLDIVALARNGREAVELFDRSRPQVCFLDVHMPGVNGIDAAHVIGDRAHLVFVTAFDQYAVQAFAEGALDYLVKPVEPVRLAATVSRLQARLRESRPVLHTEALLQELAARLKPSGEAPRLRWIRAQVGQQIRLIAVDDIQYLRSDSKYTKVVWRGDGGGEALVTTPLKELVAQLDPARFVQVHRSVVVNLQAISHVTRGENETAHIHLRHGDDVLPVSRSYGHLFKAM